MTTLSSSSLRFANQRGELLSKDHSKLAESETSFELASLILSRLINDHKPIAHYREEMTSTLVGRTVARLAMDRTPDAERDCQDAFDLVSRLIEERTRGAVLRNRLSTGAFLAES